VLATAYWIDQVTNADGITMMLEGDKIKNDAYASFLIYYLAPCLSFSKSAWPEELHLHLLRGIYGRF